MSVDLPPVIALRQRLLPPSPRIVNLAQSALDDTWMDSVDDTHGVFITAEGLLMYLQPDEAMGLIAQCAKRFPGGQMFFDLPPVMVKKLAPKGMRSSKHYRVPPMPFSLSLRQLAALVYRPRGPSRARRPDAEGARAILQVRVSEILAVPADKAAQRCIRVAGIRLTEVRVQPTQWACRG